jgi:hypothetical protein
MVRGTYITNGSELQRWLWEYFKNNQHTWSTTNLPHVSETVKRVELETYIELHNINDTQVRSQLVLYKKQLEVGVMVDASVPEAVYTQSLLTRIGNMPDFTQNVIGHILRSPLCQYGRDHLPYWHFVQYLVIEQETHAAFLTYVTKHVSFLIDITASNKAKNPTLTDSLEQAFQTTVPEERRR